MVFDDRTENFLDGSGQNHVEDEKVAFGSVGEVVLTAAWLLHGANILELLDEFFLTDIESFKHVETAVFDELSDNLEGDLISPLINYRHVNIINKQDHFFVVLRHVGLTRGLLGGGLGDGLIEIEWSGGGGKVHSFENLVCVLSSI